MKPKRPAPSKARGSNAAGSRTTTTVDGDAFWQQPSLAAAILVGLAIAVYLPTFRAEFVGFDDNAYVVKNASLASLDGMRQIWLEPRSQPQYYPVTFTAFWLEYQLWGLRPAGYHLVNVLMHATCAVLFWRLLQRLHVPGAWLAAAIFVVHPVEVESVAWVTELKNSLSLALALGAILCYLQFAPVDAAVAGAPSAATTIERRWTYYALAVLLFAAALLSKTAVVTLPGVLLVFAWWQRGRIAWRDVWPVVPLVALSVAASLVTMWIEKHQVGATGRDFDFSLVDRILIAGRALWFYAGKLVWPYPLAFFYPRWQIDATAWWQYLFPLSFVALCVALWLARAKIGRGSLAAVLIFAGVLLPALGFSNINFMRFSFVADHFQYHASLSLIALAAAGLATWGTRMVANAARRPRSGQTNHARLALGPFAVGPVLATAVALVVVLGATTFARTRVYHDGETLHRDAIAKNPANWQAHVNLFSHLKSDGRTAEGIGFLRKVALLNSDDPMTLNNVGVALVECDDGSAEGAEYYAEGIEHLKTAARLQPDYLDAHLNLAKALLRHQQPAAAVPEFTAALEIEPDNVSALYGLGIALRFTGDDDGSRRRLQQAVDLDPGHALAQGALGTALAKTQQWSEAEAHFAAAIAIDPTMVDTQVALGDVLTAQRKFPQAIERYQAALAALPDYPAALRGLGTALLETGQIDHAIERLQAAIRLDPEDVAAQTQWRRAVDLQRRTKHD